MEKYLGMRSESGGHVPSSCAAWDEGIYDPEEYEKAIKWADENMTMGWDKNPKDMQHTREYKRWCLETNVQDGHASPSDMMMGNPRLAELGFAEEAVGHNAIAGRLPGTAPVDRPSARTATLWSRILNSSAFDWNGIREPFVVATENDQLNGLSHAVWPSC